MADLATEPSPVLRRVADGIAVALMVAMCALMCALTKRGRTWGLRAHMEACSPATIRALTLFFSSCAPCLSMCALSFDEARMGARMVGEAVGGSDQ